MKSRMELLADSSFTDSPSEEDELMMEPEMETKKGKAPITRYMVLTAIVCFAGSSLQFGYNLSVINAPQSIIEEYFKDVNNFKDFLWPLAVSIFAVGGMFGAFLGPTVAKYIGRKKTLLINNALAITGGVFLGVTKATDSVTILIFGRIIVGINAGVNTSVAPMYLSEIAPVQLRGSLGTLSQFGIVTGILLGNILGLEEVLGNSTGWPYLFGLTAAIAVMQLIVLPFCPQSPRYLLAIKNDESNAVKNLQKLRGYEDVTQEVNEIKAETEKAAAMEQVTVVQLFKNSEYHKPLLISVVLQLAQQLSGIGGILYYSTELFSQAGLTNPQGQKASIGVGGLSVIMTIIVVFLVEIKGRRFLMLLGLGGMAIFYVICTIFFYLVEENYDWAPYPGVVCTLLAVALFQIGPGAIPWFIVAELFEQNSLSAAVSIAGPCNWLGNFAVGLLFPVLNKHIRPFTFIPFLVLLVIFFLFTYFFVPETKGMTIAEIKAKLRNKTGGSAESRDGRHGNSSAL